MAVTQERRLFNLGVQRPASRNDEWIKGLKLSWVHMLLGGTTQHPFDGKGSFYIDKRDVTCTSRTVGVGSTLPVEFLYLDYSSSGHQAFP